MIRAYVPDQQGNEPAIFKAVFCQGVVLASLVGIIVMFYTYVAVGHSMRKAA